MNETNLLPKLPPAIDYTEFLKELISAHKSVATLEAYQQQVKFKYNYDIALATRESLASLKLDGVATSLEDILDHQAGVTAPTERIRIEISHTHSYSRSLSSTPITWRTRTIDETEIKKLHRDLTLSKANADVEHDEFRDKAIEIPDETNMYQPPTKSEITSYVTDIFEYFYNQDSLDDLVKIAICHYQFEAVQPFDSNNGRVGRLLTQIMLYQKKLLSRPYLQLSDYFEKNRQSYYQALRDVSQHNDWNGWIKFFLKAIDLQARVTVALIKEAQELEETLLPKCLNASNEYGKMTYELLMKQPVFTANDLRQYARIDAGQTAYNIIDTLLKERIITDATPDRQRGKRYECSTVIQRLYIAERQMYLYA